MGEAAHLSGQGQGSHQGTYLEARGGSRERPAARLSQRGPGTPAELKGLSPAAPSCGARSGQGPSEPQVLFL